MNKSGANCYVAKGLDELQVFFGGVNRRLAEGASVAVQHVCDLGEHFLDSLVSGRVLSRAVAVGIESRERDCVHVDFTNQRLDQIEDAVRGVLRSHRREATT